MAVPYPVINDTPPRTQSIAGLNQFIYSTTWTANDASEILVYSRLPSLAANDITQLVNANTYTVQFIGDQNLVQVTFNALQNPPQFNIVTIVRNTLSNWLNNYTNTNFTPSMLNSDFDTLTLVDQQNQLWSQIAPHYNFSEVLNTPIDLILPILGANQLWAKNSTNTAFIAIDINELPSPFAPDDAPFVTYTADASLTNNFNLGSLGSGILAQNVASSISTPYILSLPLGIPFGGTGNTTFTAYSVILGGTTATGAFQNVTGLGNSGQSLTSQGAGLPPIWQDVTSVTPSALTRVSDTNVTLTLGGTPATALLQSVSLTLGWSGQLSLTRGGSNASLTASNGGIVYSTASAMAILSGTATANQVLLSGVSSAPAWSTATYPPTTTINQLLYSSADNVIGGITAANNGVLISGTTGVPSWLANSGTPGYVLTANAGAPASWQPVSADGAVTTINGDSGSASPSAGVVTISGGSTGLTTSGSSATLNLTGTLAVNHGGTGVTSVTTSPSATVWAGWDANSNFTANNLIPEMTSTVSSGSTIILTVASKQVQNVTGTTAQTVQMPDVTTLPRIGMFWTLLNNTSALITIVSSGSNTIGTITAGNSAYIYCTALTGTTAASWFMFVPGFTPAAFTAANDTNVTATLTGFPTVALLQPLTFTLGWTGQLGLTRGGTNSSLTASNGGIVYSTASALAILSGTSTAQQLLVSGASSSPQWTTTTYPLTNAINTMMYASSANVLGSIAAANSSVLITSAGGVPSFSTTLPNGIAATNMALTTPTLGTPTSGVATNLTATGGLRSRQVFISGSSATYTKPANVTSILVQIWGGGGGGGGSAGGAGNVGAGGGGGAGGYAELYIASASGTYTYTVGGGGAGGTAGNNAGTTGSTSTFSASSLQATGGTGGNGGATTATVISTLPVAGGTGTNGNVNATGAPGLGALVVSAPAGVALAGVGGSSSVGGGGFTVALGTGGAGGIASGGGGGLSTTVNAAGGAGGAGLIIVWEFS